MLMGMLSCGCQGVDVSLLILMRCRIILDRHRLTLMEKVMEMQIVQEKQLKLLVAKTTGVVVAEIVLPDWL